MIFFTSTKTSAAPRHWIAVLLVLLGAALMSPARAATLTNLQANTLPGDGMEVRLDFEGAAPR
ncbi:hypothetical protein ASALC70_01696 [Alcanivorax sp. ALC70]|nr:hypothetical protein ASALC70_01696 [Alcanivorax sp. ALC70]